MSFKQFITWMRGNQEENDRFTRIVGFFVYLYIMFAGLWTICYLVSEIFTKMGVG